MSCKSTLTTPAVVAISFCLIGPTFPAAADILHVPGDFPTIQEAIDAATDGDEVEVHPGTYNEAIDLLGKAIWLRSSDGPEVTTIDGTGNFHVVQCVNGEGPDTILDGFTITGGNANGDDQDGLGGGMVNAGSSSPTVTNCIFSGNSAGSGGGMYNTGGSPTVTNCTFTGNTANFGGGMLDRPSSSSTVTNCTFTGNTATTGGGMLSSGNSTVINCTFTENTANFGGGMATSLGNSTVINCTFTGNTATDPIGWGGGMLTQHSNTTVSNCIFSGNSADSGGGMFNLAGGNPTVTNCTFIGNSASFGGGGMYNWDNSSPSVTSCILWGDMPDEIVNDDPDFDNPTVSFSDVQGGLPAGTIDGGGNIDADPMFVDPDTGDYRLMPGSPCIDAGNNWGVPIDENDYDEDGVLCELFPVDLDGNPRFNADEADFDPGCGVPVVVDMGAYEYQFDPADQVTFADLNADGTVGAADLLGLLVSWGPCARGCCLADLDVDGTVGASDLLALLVNWGPCP